MIDRYKRKGGKDTSQTSKLQYLEEKNAEAQKRLIESMARSRSSFEEMEERNPGRIEKYKEFVEDRNNEIERLTEELEKLSEELIEKIDADLGALSIPEILDKYKNEIDKIEFKDDRRLELLREKYPNATFTYFSRIYHILCNKDINFIYHTPIKAFKGFVSYIKNECLPLHKLTNAQRIEFEKYLIETDRSVFKDPTFKRFYLKYFPSFIGDLETTEEVKFCLEMYPHQYPFINIKVYNQLQAIGETLKLVTRSPKVLEYMTYEEREKFVEDYPKGFGTALMREPSILDFLDEKFFSRHNARLIFTNYPKAKLREAFGDRVYRHENLCTHIFKNNYHKPDPVLKP